MDFLVVIFNAVIDHWRNRVDQLSDSQLDNLIGKQDEWFLLADDDDLGDQMAAALRGSHKQKVDFIMSVEGDYVKAYEDGGLIEFLKSEFMSEV